MSARAEMRAARTAATALLAALALSFTLAGCAAVPTGESNPVQTGNPSRETHQIIKPFRVNAPDGFDPSMAPSYVGEPSAEVNGGWPFFDAEQLVSLAPLELYSDLDQYGRCGPAVALIGPETLPKEERGPIGEVRPSGWQIAKYDWIDGKYLYNRCHLIGYQLAGENANEKNLITGTRSMNVLGMQPYENKVAWYVKDTGNHVLYRVTPYFEGRNPIADGVLMEAQSIEDGGQGIRFCIWCFNEEPGVQIDRSTGTSSAT